MADEEITDIILPYQRIKVTQHVAPSFQTVCVAMWSNNHQGDDRYLTVAHARQLAAQLIEAAEKVEAYDPAQYALELQA